MKVNVLSRLGIVTSDFLTNEEEIKKLLEKAKISDYKIASNGTVDINGDVYSKNMAHLLTKGHFAIKLGKVSGDFVCSPKLVSLEGGPREVSGDFKCNDLPGLTSLKGAPEKVGDYFICDNTPISSLEGAPK